MPSGYATSCCGTVAATCCGRLPWPRVLAKVPSQRTTSLDCPADDNLKAVIQNILKDEARVTKVVSAKGQSSALATELSKANLETKPKPATSDGGLDREGR
jgi:hypothetical protein